ncbi:MAG TPA: tetratricopeptide repeat protein [Verrucomicrobiae bacterium]
MTGCSSLMQQANLSQVMVAEYQGDHSVFVEYITMATQAADLEDWPTSYLYNLRAYRNTGIQVLAREEPPLYQSLLEGKGNPWLIAQAEQYVLKLDALTPLPGTGSVTNDLLDANTNYCRSWAAYNWAIAAGHLGDFAGAEKAFLYALQLEEARGDSDHLVASRYFELARLNHAWHRPQIALRYYRQALDRVRPSTIEHDPIGYATVLQEYASYLSEDGQAEAAAIQFAAATRLREEHPHTKAKFILLPYPNVDSSDALPSPSSP